MKNRLIIFDCFGVIFEEVAHVFLKRHLPTETVDEIKDKLFVPADLGLVTHEELLSAGGEYSRLYEMQSCWYRDDYGKEENV